MAFVARHAAVNRSTLSIDQARFEALRAIMENMDMMMWSITHNTTVKNLYCRRRKSLPRVLLLCSLSSLFSFAYVVGYG